MANADLVNPSPPLEQPGGAPPPVAPGAWPFLGHLLAFRRDPLAMLRRIRDDCGEMGELRLAGQKIAMLYGPEAQEAFFRAPDEQLDQAARPTRSCGRSSARRRRLRRQPRSSASRR